MYTKHNNKIKFKKRNRSRYCVDSFVYVGNFQPASQHFATDSHPWLLLNSFALDMRARNSRGNNNASTLFNTINHHNHKITINTNTITATTTTTTKRDRKKCANEMETDERHGIELTRMHGVCVQVREVKIATTTTTATSTETFSCKRISFSAYITQFAAHRLNTSDRK